MKQIIQITLSEAQALFVGHATAMAMELTIHGNTENANTFAELIRQLLVTGIFNPEECDKLDKTFKLMFEEILKNKTAAEQDK